LKTTKKLICALLTMIMLLSLFPMAAFASDEGTQNQEQQTGNLNNGNGNEGAGAVTLTGIEVTSSPTELPYNTHVAGELIVTATYSDGTSKEVTGVTVDPAIVAIGTNSYTVSYTEREITKTAQVEITKTAQVEITGKNYSYFPLSMLVLLNRQEALYCLPPPLITQM